VTCFYAKNVKKEVVGDSKETMPTSAILEKMQCNLLARLDRRERRCLSFLGGAKPAQGEILTISVLALVLARW